MESPDNSIHPTAFIGPDVQLGKGNEIGAFSYLDGNISLGNDNKIWNHVVLHGNLKIGNDNEFFPFSTVGFTADIPDSDPPFRKDGWILIGDRNTLKSYVHLQSPMRTDLTHIANECYFMPHAYVAHDCRIGKGVILSAGSKIAGVCVLEDYVNAGIGALVHQRCTIGESAFLGMNATITKPVPPFAIVTGSPARILKLNRRGLEKRGFTTKELDPLEKTFWSILTNGDGTTYNNPLENKLQIFLNNNKNCLRTFH
jgi:UDP-N-acetylglucosamine acyltransferase